ncbi:MAG: branched-chain amino acid ABC transporter permease [Rhizobiaceae bacterium]
MNSIVLSQTIVSGLLLGGIFALVAAGLTLIFGVMKILNFAHGDFLMLGMYFAFVLSVMFGIDPYLSAIAALPLFFGLGWIVQAYLIRPVLKAPENIQILLTVGLSLFLQNVALFLFSPDFQSLSTTYGRETLSVGGVSISYVRLLACAVAVATCGALYLLLTRTDVGKALRACAEEDLGSKAVGIDVDRMYKIAFGLGTACVALAGVLMTPFFYIAPQVGLSFTLTAFVVVVLGGLGSLPGALIGGFVVGLIEAMGEIFLASPSMKQMATFSVFLIILLLRPQGLFGGRLT